MELKRKPYNQRTIERTREPDNHKTIGPKTLRTTELENRITRTRYLQKCRSIEQNNHRIREP